MRYCNALDSGQGVFTSRLAHSWQITPIMSGAPGLAVVLTSADCTRADSH